MTTAEYRSRYASTEASDYEFACKHPDCPEVSHEKEDFQQCESCAALLCDTHALHMLNDATLPFCVTCATCACGQEAAFMCDECGKLVCWNCVWREDVVVDAGYFCRACFQDSEAPTPDPCRFHSPVSTQQEVTCPF